MDATIPFEFYPSNEIIDVYNGSRPSAGIEFFPNPAYGDKEALKSETRLHVRRVNCLINGATTNPPVSIYFPNATISGVIEFRDCWNNGMYQSWYNQCSKYGSSSLLMMAVLEFRNSQEEIIHRKLIRLRFVK